MLYFELVGELNYYYKFVTRWFLCEQGLGEEVEEEEVSDQVLLEWILLESFYKMQIHLLLFKKSNLNFECEKQIINGLMF